MEYVQFSYPDCRTTCKPSYDLLASGTYRCPWCQLLFGVEALILEDAETKQVSIKEVFPAVWERMQGRMGAG